MHTVGARIITAAALALGTAAAAHAQTTSVSYADTTTGHARRHSHAEWLGDAAVVAVKNTNDLGMAIGLQRGHTSTALGTVPGESKRTIPIAPGLYGLDPVRFVITPVGV